jgi:hypothetical protein
MQTTELAVQKFLREGGTFEELTAKYAIEPRFHSRYPGLVMLKYNQIDSPMGERIVQECRGLILNSLASWDIVSRPFDKFFNHGEGHAAPIDWSTARVQQKVDGSLMTLFHHDNAWMVASNGSPDATGEVNGFGFTFNKLFWDTFTAMGLMIPPDGCEDECFMFELTSPYNRVVVPHKEAKLTLLAVRNRKTGEWIPRIRWELFYPTVAEYPLQTMEQVLATFNHLDPVFNEGYVVVDGRGNRIKVKHPGYLAIHRMTDGFGPRRMMELVLANEASEFLTYFPEWKPTYELVKDKYDGLVRELEDAYGQIAHLTVQKDFALEACKTRCSGALFSLRSGKVSSIRQYLSGMDAKKVMEWVGVKEDLPTLTNGSLARPTDERCVYCGSSSGAKCVCWCVGT